MRITNNVTSFNPNFKANCIVKGVKGIKGEVLDFKAALYATETGFIDKEYVVDVFHFRKNFFIIDGRTPIGHSIQAFRLNGKGTEEEQQAMLKQFAQKLLQDEETETIIYPKKPATNILQKSCKLQRKVGIVASSVGGNSAHHKRKQVHIGGQTKYKNNES